jgi:hypothetical protein
MAVPARSAAIAASITWRSTAERLRVPWERRWSSQASCASVMETLRGGAKEAMDAWNSEHTLSAPGKA